MEKTPDAFIPNPKLRFAERPLKVMDLKQFPLAPALTAVLKGQDPLAQWQTQCRPGLMPQKYIPLHSRAKRGEPRERHFNHPNSSTDHLQPHGIRALAKRNVSFWSRKAVNCPVVLKSSAWLGHWML